MLAGALVAVEVSAATGGVALALLAAALVGAVVGLAMSLVVTRLRGERDHRRPRLHASPSPASCATS